MCELLGRYSVRVSLLAGFENLFEQRQVLRLELIPAHWSPR
jgi:hypothetical protein